MIDPKGSAAGIGLRYVTATRVRGRGARLDHPVQGIAETHATRSHVAFIAYPIVRPAAMSRCSGGDRSGPVC